MTPYSLSSYLTAIRGKILPPFSEFKSKVFLSLIIGLGRVRKWPIVPAPDDR
jgi:hypothetical protein